jgi:nitrogen-specific signal transduction histidine kinase
MTVLSDAAFYIPLQDLPIAAAALDSNGVIVASNRQFARLCGNGNSPQSGQRLADIVSEGDRPVIEEALNVLTVLGDQAPRMCNIRALRDKPPSLWLAIDMARLGTDVAVPYVACVQPIPRRRRQDRSPDGPFPDPPRANGTKPRLLTLSHECFGPLMAIRGWAQMAENGMLSRDQMARALMIIGRNATRLTGLIDNVFDLSRGRRRSAVASHLTRPGR